MDDAVLTGRQQQVLAFIQSHIGKWGYPPTVREIGAHLGVRSTNAVADHLKALKRKGLLTQAGTKSRTLKPVTGAVIRLARSGQGVAIPLLGRVAAGAPILAEEDAEGTVVVDSMLVRDGKRLFALKVVGDSMIDAGIHDGDFIFVQKRHTAQRGAIVVVMIDGEATVKRFFHEGQRIRLQPENPRLQPIYVSARDFRDTQILGVVVGVYRQLAA
jgi:repressor LexA